MVSTFWSFIKKLPLYAASLFMMPSDAFAATAKATVTVNIVPSISTTLSNKILIANKYHEADKQSGYAGKNSSRVQLSTEGTNKAKITISAVTNSTYSLSISSNDAVNDTTGRNKIAVKKLYLTSDPDNFNNIHSHTHYINGVFSSLAQNNNKTQLTNNENEDPFKDYVMVTINYN